MHVILLFFICVCTGAIAKPDDQISPDPIPLDLATIEDEFRPSDINSVSAAPCDPQNTGSGASIQPAPASTFFDIFRKREIFDGAIAVLNRGSSPSGLCLPQTGSPPEDQSGKAKRPKWAVVCDKAKIRFAVCCTGYPQKRPKSRRNVHQNHETFDLEGCDQSGLLFPFLITSSVLPSLLSHDRGYGV